MICVVELFNLQGLAAGMISAGLGVLQEVLVAAKARGWVLDGLIRMYGERGMPMQHYIATRRWGELDHLRNDIAHISSLVFLLKPRCQGLRCS